MWQIEDSNMVSPKLGTPTDMSNLNLKFDISLFHMPNLKPCTVCQMTCQF
jgi:hypothetical protein